MQMFIFTWLAKFRVNFVLLDVCKFLDMGDVEIGEKKKGAFCNIYQNWVHLIMSMSHHCKI